MGKGQLNFNLANFDYSFTDRIARRKVNAKRSFWDSIYIFSSPCSFSTSILLALHCSAIFEGGILNLTDSVCEVSADKREIG